MHFSQDFRIAATLAAVTLLIVMLIYSPRIVQDDRPSFRTEELMEAITKFARESRERGEPVPTTVTLRDLNKLGYVSEQNLGAFQGMTVVFHRDGSEIRPGSILVTTWRPGGDFLVALGDGSVRTLSTNPDLLT